MISGLLALAWLPFVLWYVSREPSERERCGEREDGVA